MPTPSSSGNCHTPEPPTSPAWSAAGIIVRRLRADDSISAITGLLHRAYAKQVAMGLRPLAARQDDAITRRRVGSGECFVACSQPEPARDGAPASIVGVVILNELEPDEGPEWFRRPGVASFSQLGVDPACQGQGIGRTLLSAVEQRAMQLGHTELALSMAEPDSDLRDFYRRSGYRIIGTWKWPYTNYLSLILSKPLRETH